MIQQPAGDPHTRLGGRIGRSLGRIRSWRGGRRGISRDGIDALGRAHGIPAERADELCPFLLARPVAAHLQPGKACLPPCVLAEALRAGDGDLRPAARMRSVDQAVNDLRVLARGCEPSPAIFERGRDTRRGCYRLAERAGIAADAATSPPAS